MKLPDNYYAINCYWAHMVTFRCNGNCPYCILNGRGKAPIPSELTGEEIVAWWNGLHRPPMQKLSLIGGEPFEHPDILAIVAGLKHYKLTITTNCASGIHNRPGFPDELKCHPTSTLRVNTSFHPHLISPKNYIRVVRAYQVAGHLVDQIALVNYPGVREKYNKEICEVVDNLGRLQILPYLGFWNKEEGVHATPDPANIEPNENYFDQAAPTRFCGLSDMEAYRDISGQSVPRRVECTHPFKSLIIGPNGDYFHCHYKLYYGIDPVCNIRDFKPVTNEKVVWEEKEVRGGVAYLDGHGFYPSGTQSMTCDYYGFCNCCDVPRVGCVKNPTAREIDGTTNSD